MFVICSFYGLILHFLPVSCPGYQYSIEHVYDLEKSGKIAYIKAGKNIRPRPEVWLSS
jgi:hypothetical protein